MRISKLANKICIHVILFVVVACLFSCQSDVRNGTRIPPVVKKTKAQSEKDALLFLTELITRDIDLDVNYYKRAKIYLEQGRYPKALSDINEAIEREGNKGEYFLLRGKLNRASGQLDQALEDAERAEALQQNSPELFILLADILLVKGQVKEAGQYLSNAMQMAPYEGAAYYIKGMIEARKRDSTAALTSFAQALDMDPRLLGAYVQSTVINRRMRNYDQALAINSAAIRRFPDTPDLYFERGEIYSILTKSDSALIFYRKTIALNPNNVIALQKISAIQIKQKNYYKALSSLQQLLKLKPDYRGINNMLGLCYEKVGNYSRARVYYNFSLDLNKTDKDALNGLWRIHLRDLGQPVGNF